MEECGKASKIINFDHFYTNSRFIPIYYMSSVIPKPTFCICEKTKVQISCSVTMQMFRTFVFATKMVQSLYFLNPKFHAPSHFLLALFVLDLVGNPEDRFSHNATHTVGCKYGFTFVRKYSHYYICYPAVLYPRLPRCNSLRETSFIVFITMNVYYGMQCAWVTEDGCTVATITT